MIIKPVVAWYDLWFGIYFDKKKSRLYFMVPIFGFYIEFRQADRKDIKRMVLTFGGIGCLIGLALCVKVVTGAGWFYFGWFSLALCFVGGFINTVCVLDD